MSKIKREEKFSGCYDLAMKLSAFLFHTIMPVKYHDLENAALDAPYVLISNHNSLFDPMVVGYPVKRYQIRFLGKKELEKVGVLKAMFKNLKMISVDRHNMDMSAMRACLKVLKEGHILGIFPEGTRHKHGLMEELESGTAMIALRSGVKVIPAYMTGKAHFFRKMDVYFGEPIDLSDLIAKGIDKETCQEALDRFTQVYRDMAKIHPNHHLK